MIYNFAGGKSPAGEVGCREETLVRAVWIDSWHATGEAVGRGVHIAEIIDIGNMAASLYEE